MKSISVVFGLILAIVLPASSTLADGQIITVAPTSTVPGGIVTVTGSGLGSSISVPIHLIGADGAELTVWTARTDDAGTFNVQVEVPHSVALGAYQLHAEGNPPADAALTVAVSFDSSVPTLTATPTDTVPGGIVTVTGSGLGTRIAVPIHLIGADGAELTVWTAYTDAAGAFIVQVQVPHSVALGSYELHAEGIAPADTALTVASVLP